MANPRIYTETELQIKVADGDETAFRSLFDRYWDKVYSTALTILKSPSMAEDDAQETFLRVWQSRVKLRDIRDLDAYLFVITRNLVFSRLSRLKKEEAYRHYQLTGAARSSPGDDSGNRVTYNELASVIEKGIRQLPPQQQRAFRLSREKGLSHEEVAREMGINKETVKDYIVRAIAFLRKYLKGYAAILLVVKEIINFF